MAGKDDCLLGMRVCVATAGRVVLNASGPECCSYGRGSAAIARTLKTSHKFRFSVTSNSG